MQIRSEIVTLAVAGAVLAVSAMIAPVAAQTLRDLKTCQAASSGNQDDAIHACSIFIQTRRAVGGRAPLPAVALAAMYRLRAVAHLRKGEYESVVEDYTRSISVHRSAPDGDAVAHEFRGVAYLALGDRRRAVEDFTQAIRLGKDKALLARNYVDRAELYQFSGDEERARLDYEKAIELAPSSRANFEDTKEFNAQWMRYLKEIEEDNDCPNWTDAPFTMFHRANTLQSAPADTASTAQKGSASCDLAATHWKSAEAIGTLEAYQDHLARFPDCAFATLARARIASLGGSGAPAKAGGEKTCPAGMSADSDGDCVRDRTEKRKALPRRASAHPVQRTGGAPPALNCANTSDIMACAHRLLSTAPVINGN